MKNKGLYWVVSLIVIAILSVAVLYAAVIVGKIPIDLPFYDSGAASIQYDPVEGKMIANEWKDVIIYKMKERHHTVEDILAGIESGTIVIENKEEEEFLAEFDLIEPESFKAYIENHQDLVENGYGSLFIDKVSLNNTTTGIKTIYGDDVMAIDAINKILIIGIDVPYVDKQGRNATAEAKLAVVYNKAQLDMSIVDDLYYWDEIDIHVKREQGIFGVNANGYQWNDAGTWAMMYGTSKIHDKLVRKADIAENTICFDKFGNMSIGTSIDNAYNAVEYAPTLIKNGKTVYDESTHIERNVRMAQTGIGQTSDDKTLICVISGGIYDSGLGGTYSDMLDIMEEYKAQDASMLSGGSRTVMYWNGRVVSKNEGYKTQGAKLPTAIVVKSAVD